MTGQFGKRAEELARSALSRVPEAFFGASESAGGGSSTSERGDRTSESAKSGPYRALVAEDAKEMQLLLRHFLEKGGAETVLASDGQMALELARASIAERSPFDIVILDLNMPVLDGYEVARRLRADKFSGVILALTAHSLEAARPRCEEAGCDAVLCKPVDRGRLWDAITTSLANRPNRCSGPAR